MAVHTLQAQITEPGHPLQGAPVQIRWAADSDGESYVAADVKIVPPGGGWSRWVPVQLIDQHITPEPDEAA